jgi:hypothetical protein
MTTKVQDSKLKRFLVLATDSRVLTQPVLITLIILSVLIHMAPNGGTVSGSLLVRAVIASIAFLPGIGAIALAHQIAKRIASERWQITLILISYFVGGAIRGLVMAITFYNLGMADSLHLDFRIPGSAVPFGLATTIATYAAAALNENRERIYNLQKLQAELSDALEGSSGDEARLRARAIYQIENTVQKELSGLYNIGYDISITELKSLATEIVRPLSHTLAQRIPQWQARKHPELKLKWHDVASQIRPELSLRPKLLSALATLTALTAFIVFFGITLAIPLVICSFFSLYLTINLLTRLTTRIGAISSILLRVVLITLVLMITAIPSGIVASIILRESPDQWFVLKGGLVILPVFGWFLALGGAAQVESARIESEYVAGINELSRLKARLNIINWFEHGELARVLHGPVQSAINKGVIRLQNSNEEMTRESIIDEIRTSVEQALLPKTRWDGTQEEFSKICNDLTVTWKNLCQIDAAISPRASAVINGDAATSSICWDIVHESCSNAIQHGKATWISIRISDPFNGSIIIEVIDNGTQFNYQSKSGLGSTLLDACTISWSTNRQDNQTILTAELPIESNLKSL